jgi:hypothetical protein
MNVFSIKARLTDQHTAKIAKTSQPRGHLQIHTHQSGEERKSKLLLHCMNSNTSQHVRHAAAGFSAPDPGADGHEGAKRAPTLHHALPDLRHELSSPQAHPPGAKAAEEESRGHPDAHTHHEAELDAVEAAGALATG